MQTIYPTDTELKDIPGFEGRYAITKDGRVWSYPKGRNNKNGMWLKPFFHHCGYHLVCLTDGSVNKKTHLCHRLVAEAFIPNPDNLPQVNHIDGDKTNNAISNLEWCDNSYNTQHAYDTGLKKAVKGETHGSAKLTENQVRTIRTLFRLGITQQKIADYFGVAQKTISKIFHRKTWSHI